MFVDKNDFEIISNVACLDKRAAKSSSKCLFWHPYSKIAHLYIKKKRLFSLLDGYKITYLFLGYTNESDFGNLPESLGLRVMSNVFTFEKSFKRKKNILNFMRWNKNEFYFFPNTFFLYC